MDNSPELETKRTQIRQFIDAEKDRLLSILRLYAIQSGLASTEHSSNVEAAKLFDDLVAGALDLAHQFDLSHQPFAWLMVIAVTLIRLRQDQSGRRSQIPVEKPALSTDAMIDQLPLLFSQAPGEREERLADQLSRISNEDRRVLHAATELNLDVEALAQQLGMPPGAARVRLHRALEHLRAVM